MTLTKSTTIQPIPHLIRSFPNTPQGRRTLWELPNHIKATLRVYQGAINLLLVVTYP